MRLTTIHLTVSALAGVLAVSFTGSTTAQLYSAIAPEARTVHGMQTATFFVTALNDTDQSLTNCRPVYEAESLFPTTGTELALIAPDTFSYQTVGVSNQLTGTPDTPVALAPGGRQGFLIAITPTQSSDNLTGARLIPRIECNEQQSQYPFLLAASLMQFSTEAYASPPPDIIAISATPSADGIVRLPDVGADRTVEVFTVAAVNIGGAGEVRVGQFENIWKGQSGVTGYYTSEICETGQDGSCLGQRFDTSMTVDFEADETKTFSVFVYSYPQSGLSFQPDTLRHQIAFRGSSLPIYGATSVAVSAAVIDEETSPAGRYSGTVAGVSSDGTQSLDPVTLSNGQSVQRNSSVNAFILPNGHFVLNGFRDLVFWPDSLTNSGQWMAVRSGPPSAPIRIPGTRSYLLESPNVLIMREREDSEPFEADFRAIITAGEGVVGTLTPPSAPLYGDVEPLGETYAVRATLRGDISRAERPLDWQAGRWLVGSTNHPEVLLTLSENGELTADFRGATSDNQVAGIKDCTGSGSMSAFAEAENYFSIDLYMDETESCDPRYAGKHFSGIAMVANPFETRWNVDDYMSILLADTTADGLTALSPFVRNIDTFE